MFKHYFFGAAAAGAAAPSAGVLAAWAASISFCFWAASNSLCILPPCLTNFLVNENSPNLCPIISSVTKTGTWTLPLWTPKVKPIISGIIVQSLAHVLIIVLSPALNLPTFFNSFSSTYGPFLSDRDILFGSSYYKFTRLFLFVSCFSSACYFSISGLWASCSSALSAFSASIRVVNRIHGCTSYFRSSAKPSGFTSFTQNYRAVFGI